MRVTSCIGKCSKVFILLVNIIIFLVGGGGLGLGIYYHLNGGLYEYVFKEAEVITVPVVLMFLGCLFITISFFAIVGALCEVNIMLKIYMGIIAIVLLLEVILMCVCIAMKGYAEKQAIAVIHNLMDHYGDKDADELNIITKTIDQTQKWLTCCGVEGPKDWTSSDTAAFWVKDRNTDENGDPITPANLPPSCCDATAESCTIDTPHHTLGCKSQLYSFIDSNVTYVTVVGIVLILLQAFVLIGALKIRFELSSKYDEDEFAGGTNMEITSL